MWDLFILASPCGGRRGNGTGKSFSCLVRELLPTREFKRRQPPVSEHSCHKQSRRGDEVIVLPKSLSISWECLTYAAFTGCDR